MVANFYNWLIHNHWKPDYILDKLEWKESISWIQIDDIFLFEYYDTKFLIMDFLL